MVTVKEVMPCRNEIPASDSTMRARGSKQVASCNAEEYRPPGRESIVSVVYPSPPLPSPLPVAGPWGCLRVAGTARPPAVFWLHYPRDPTAHGCFLPVASCHIGNWRRCQWESLVRWSRTRGIMNVGTRCTHNPYLVSPVQWESSYVLSLHSYILSNRWLMRICRLQWLANN